jgi:hypothetical protein
MAVATSGTLTYNTGTGGVPNSGTDAYNTFNGFANMVDVIKMGSSSASVTLTFTGLDPTKTYMFATSADRASSSYTYNSIITISDFDTTTITNESTVESIKGTASYAQDKTTFNGGYNTVNGYAARWTGIQPGTDGDFVVSYTTTTDQGYGPQAFVLAEELDTTPTITTTGSLTAFSANGHDSFRPTDLHGFRQ